MSDQRQQRALDFIAVCADPKKLKTPIINAAREGDGTVEAAARRALYELLPEQQPGSLAHDVWRSVHALEDALTNERGKTTRLGRTRQKISRDGEATTVADLVTKDATEGFRMLVDRGMIDLTFEAVALRHPDAFPEAVLGCARARLEALHGPH